MADKELEKDMDDREPRDEGPDEADQEDREEDRDERAAARPAAVTPGGALVARPAGPGLFHIYKPGQGYWTRLATAVGVGLVVFSIAAFFYQQMRTWGWFMTPTGQARTGLIAGILGGLVLVVAFWAFRILNRPTVVDFLIATESEMKKVNWTSRKELIGSTKVVIFFMFLIAVMLFGFDLFFGYFFKFVRVLEFGPFG